MSADATQKCTIEVCLGNSLANQIMPSWLERPRDTEEYEALEKHVTQQRCPAWVYPVFHTLLRPYSATLNLITATA